MRVDDVRAILGRERLPARERNAEAVGDLLHRCLDAGETGLGVIDQEAAADRDGDGRHDHAVLDQRELGRAASDIDIEEARRTAARQCHRARAVRRQLALHVMAGRSANEPAGLLREQLGDGARVAPLDGFAGQDHGAGVDVGGVDARIGVAAAEETRELVRVDRVVGKVGREQDRRLPQHLAADDHEAARQCGGQALQVHAREHQVGGRGADVDADGRQLDIVGRPGDLVVARLGVKVIEFKLVHRPLWSWRRFRR